MVKKKGKTYKLKAFRTGSYFFSNLKIEIRTLDKYRIVEIDKPKKIKKMWAGVQNTLNKPKSTSFNRDLTKKQIFKYNLLNMDNPLS